ncbi:MAG: hypothetical protein ACD_57C00399G0002 [uncultured bacterium]|nr:MAG: hypothetical protein ACD_57C00399G0002 [uncultured bacterium]
MDDKHSRKVQTAVNVLVADKVVKILLYFLKALV